MSQGDNARDYSDRNEQWSEILEAILPVLSKGFVAYGETCAAAVHYAGFYDEMKRCEFSALRPDFDTLLPELDQVCRKKGIVLQLPSGFTVEDSVPYAVVCARGEEVYLYPLDTIPDQVTLRFKLFKEASQCEKKGFAGYDRLLRYNAFDLPFCTRLIGAGSSRGMGERTVFQRSVEKAGLFPARTMRLGSLEIPMPKETGSWTLEMIPGRIADIKTIQEESLGSLEEIDRMCANIGADYFLVGGSMLGAVRHEGFIPWDDDTDVGMLRRDYEKFCREAKKRVDGQYFLQLPSTDPHIHFVYARLRKRGYEYITFYNEDKEFDKGIWVDLFPFDARPKNEFLARIQNRAANIFARASMAFKRRREYVEHDVLLDSPFANAGDRSYLRRKKLLSVFYPVALCRLGYHAAARFFNPFFANKNDALYASFIPSYTTIAHEEIYPLRRVGYEGARLNIPHKAERFLERQYGDYRTLPSIHERFCEHGFKCLRKTQGELEGIIDE